MATAGSAPGASEAVAITFPAPPPWFKLYGPDQPAAPPAPPAPVTGSFQLYDKMFDLDEPLVNTKPNGMIRQEADGTIDYRTQLKEVVQELLPLFLELLRALVEAPESHAPALSRVSTAMAAAQHLINMVRPPQARATLEYVLQLEVADKQQALNQLREQVRALDQALSEASQQLAIV